MFSVTVQFLKQHKNKLVLLVGLIPGIRVDYIYSSFENTDLSHASDAASVQNYEYSQNRIRLSQGDK